MLTSADIQFAIIGCARPPKAKALARDMLRVLTAPNDITTPSGLGVSSLGLSERRFIID